MIDTDCGVDDAECIMTALGHLEVVGISCVVGNCPVSKSSINVAKVLQACNREVPIYKGCESPLLQQIPPSLIIHGGDGMGDTDFAKTIPGFTHCIQEEHGAIAITKQAKENPGLNIMAIGPLTNLAVALKLDPELPEKVDQLVIMGGTYRGIGNVTFSTEYNFQQDPEAAAIVLRAFKNIKLIPWELCLENDLTNPDHLNTLYSSDSLIGRFHHEIKNHYFKTLGRHFIIDAFTAIIASDPSAIEDSFKAYGFIETEGKYSKGMISYFGPEAYKTCF